MKQLFKLLSQAYPLILTEYELDKIVTLKDRETLSHLEILIQNKPLDSVACKTCNSFHEIHSQSNKQIFYVCPDGGKERVEPQEVKTWTIQYSRLFESLSKGLGIELQVKQLQKNTLWQLGTISIGNNVLPIFFTHAEVEQILTNVQRGVIIITSRQSEYTSDYARSVIALENILSDNIRRNLWSKKKLALLLANQNRKTLFSTNGDLIANGKRIASITPASPPNYFVEALNNKYDQPVSQDDIFSYAKRKIAESLRVSEWNSDYTPQTFCHKMKVVQ